MPSVPQAVLFLIKLNWLLLSRGLIYLFLQRGCCPLGAALLRFLQTEGTEHGLKAIKKEHIHNEKGSLPTPYEVAFHSEQKCSKLGPFKEKKINSAIP